LAAHAAELHAAGVSSLEIFGSVARDEAAEGSDVDLLVEFNRPVGLLEFARLQLRLEAILGSRVDLVTSDALKPGFRAVIEQNLVRAA
jgi:predicted nucleotidyltransferase